MSCPDPMHDYSDWYDNDEAMIKAMEDNNITMKEYESLPLWDPIMGDIDDYPETDDEWLDDFQGEEDWG